MVEPLANSILTTLLPRHSVVRQSSSSIRRAANGKGRTSLTSNFFVPAPRCDKGKARAVEDGAELEIEEVLACQAWARRLSKKEMWSQEGAMRSLLLGELQEGSSSQRIPRTSTSSRQRFHQSLLPTASSAISADGATFSTTASACQAAAAKVAPSFPSPQPPPQCHTIAENHTYQVLLRELKAPSKSQKDLCRLKDIFHDARQSGLFQTLSPNEALILLGLFADKIDFLCLAFVEADDIQLWGNLMRRVYTVLPSECVDTMKKDGQWDPLMCRILSYSGHLDEALSIVRRLLPTAMHNWHHQKAIDSYQLTRARLRGLSYSLEYWSTEEMRGHLVGKSLFGELVARDPGLGSALGRVNFIEDLSRRAKVVQYCLKMAVYYQNGPQAITIIGVARRWRVAPQLEYCLQVCRLLASQGDLSAARKLFNSINPDPHPEYSQTNLYICSREGDVEASKRIMEERRVAGHLTIEDRTNLFMALSRNHQCDEMKEVFGTSYPVGPDGLRIPHPPLNQYSVCIMTNSRLGNVEEVNWWLRDMERQGVAPNLQIYTHLMTLFKRVGDERSMMLAYNDLLKADIRPDPPLYTPMLSHFANRKNAKAANALLKDALRQGVIPDERMMSALMNVYVQTGSLNDALRIFEELSKPLGRSKPSLSVYNVMLKAHVLLGARFKVIQQLFHTLKTKIRIEPNQHTYAIVLTSACESDNLPFALELIEEIKAKQRKSGRTDLLSVHAMTIVMSALLRNQEVAQAKAIVDDMEQMGMKPTDVTYSQIIKHLPATRTEDDAQEAEELAKQLLESPEGLNRSGELSKKRQPVANIYVQLLSGPADRGDVEKVEKLYEQFLKDSGRPSIAIYHKLLLAYRNAGELQKATDIWPLIWDLAEQEPAVSDLAPGEISVEDEEAHVANIQAPLSVYMDVLSKAGRHGELAELWFTLQRRGFGFDIQNWNFLVVVLIRAGQVERAFEVMDKVILPNEYFNEFNRHTDAEYRKNPKGLCDPLKSYVKVPQGHPLWGSNDRIRVHKYVKHTKGRSRSKAVDISMIDRNFVYPIRVLEFIRPSWNDWHPHEVVMRTLLSVWFLLRRGFMPKPLAHGGDLLNNVAVHDISEKSSEAAHAMLDTLGHKYSRTLQAVSRFMRQEQKRLSTKEFDDMYVRR